MLKTERYLYVGFMCHQVIEKVLKGYYVNNFDETNPFTHNLTYLAERCKINDILSDSQKELIDTLEPLNVQARYPKQTEKIFRSMSYERCVMLIKDTEELYEWIKKMLLS